MDQNWTYVYLVRGTRKLYFEAFKMVCFMYNVKVSFLTNFQSNGVKLIKKNSSRIFEIENNIKYIYYFI